MSSHSVADAKNHLPKLIDRALSGEPIVITRHGQPVVELRPVHPEPKPITDADIEWLRARRAGRRSARVDSTTLIRQMRDEEDG